PRTGDRRKHRHHRDRSAPRPSARSRTGRPRKRIAMETLALDAWGRLSSRHLHPCPATRRVLMSCPLHHGSGQTVVLDPFVRDLPAEREVLYAAGPVTRVELPEGVNAWAVTHHEAARALLTDPRLVKDIA